ncbi:MAG: hypothetical protein BIFFINMI_03521 [Phycisphaerae bacterium]|nr:hypothetical protein [Phycisphaerae bacterium]
MRIQSNLLRVAVLAGVGLLLSASAAGDEVHLYGGRVVTGKIMPSDNPSVVIVESKFGTVRLQKSQVKQIVKTDDAESGSTEPAKPVERNTKEEIDLWSQTSQALDQASEGVVGLKLLEEFLQKVPKGSVADLATRQLGVWKERAEKDQIRFGPQWLPRKDVQERTELASRLFEQAAGKGLDEAMPLLDKAADANPYRTDIPFRKAQLYYEAKRMRNYAQALGDVLKIEPDNEIARNNVGVIAARDKNWGVAITNLSRAAAVRGNETALKNYGQALFLWQESLVPDKLLVCEAWGWRHKDPYWDALTEEEWRYRVRVSLATTRAMGDVRESQIIDGIHKRGQHVGEWLWGDRWIDEKEYKARLKYDDDLQAKIRKNEEDIRNTVARRDTAGTRSIRLKNYPLINDLKLPTHPGQLILMDNNGGELESFKVEAGLPEGDIIYGPGSNQPL